METGCFLQWVCFGICSICLVPAFGQDNYEIQVYGSQTQEKGSTMFELHSNYTLSGSRVVKNGVYPTHHADHETLEITQGVTDIFEIGFYFFNSIGSDGRTAYVGSHIRPRIMAPAKWNLPIGLSLSTEVGYQKSQFSEDDWTIELRPIIDKTIGKIYVSFNPTLGKFLHGSNQSQGWTFSPNVKASYAITKLLAPGIEYYGSFGPVMHFSPSHQQMQQFFLALDVDFSPAWELNVGYGVDVANPVDRSIAKGYCRQAYQLERKETVSANHTVKITP